MVLFFVALALRWDRYAPRAPALGRAIWRVQGLLRGRSRAAAAAAVGLATPLLPCGPLYGLLALAALAGSALRGVEFMLAFGLGTVPLLWLAQGQFQRVRSRLPPIWLARARLLLGLSVALVIGWRLRATLGLPGPAPGSFVCH
jgi:sulfite exporter TauE/SafE